MVFYCYNWRMRILVFGDSITQGFGDTEGGWVERFRHDYDVETIKDLRANTNYPTIFNLGISGDTTTNLLKRIESETEARLWPGERIIVLIAVGTNDDALSQHDSVGPNLSKMIEILDPVTDDILLMGNTACDEKLTRPVFWADVHYKNEDLHKTEQIIKATANKHSKKFIPIFDRFKEELDKGKNLLADGLHPNNEGHELIFHIVKPELDKLLGSK
jgi:lysophospholipase L1-like esterase